MTRKQLTYGAAGIVAAVSGVVVYRAVKSGSCGCENRKRWLRARGLWPQKAVA